MSHELNGWARPRPIRIAFLLEDGEHAALALDGVFADCYSRWGGRFSLLVPCIEGKISASYWAWLETYDPDIVYSYVPLGEADVLAVHERLSPSEYIFHELDREPKLDVFGFKPSYHYEPLSSLSTVFKVARHQPASGGGVPLKIIDSWPTESPSRFLTDNFGTYYHSQASSMYPPDAESAAGLLTIVSPEKQADRQYGIPHDLDAIASEYEAFRAFAERRATSLSVASLLFAPKLETEAFRWSRSFNLVVGDSFSDRILFWNARLFIPDWLDDDLCCLRVTTDQLESPDFLAVLGDLLKRRNHVTDGAGGQPALTIRSTSLDADQLAEVSRLVLSQKPWGTVAIDWVRTPDDLAPSSEELKDAREGSRFGRELFRRRDWNAFVWSPPTARPPVCMPDHLSDAPVRQAFTVGYWCTDYAFEYDGPGARWSTENRWMLPRRWRMAGAFGVTRVNRPQHTFPPSPRRSRNGNLAVFVSADHLVETIQVPTAFEATRYALSVDGPMASFAAVRGEVYPQRKVFWMRPSNEARYLIGVLGLTGGLPQAESFLLHPFLREVFARLGGSPSPFPAQVSPTAARLRKKYPGESTFDLTNGAERDALADLIVKAARGIKRPNEVVSYDVLRAEWRAYREKYWEANPRQGEPQDSIDWDKHEEQSLDDCLIVMRRQQILYQGHRWICPKCHHKNWVDLSELSSELTCGVCKQLVDTPVHIPWVFRPNEFLIESLRDRSVLSLIWALSALCARSQQSFMFIESACFGMSKESEAPDAEADLLVLLDGQTLLCEVKSSWRSLRTKDITALVELSIRLRPDVALLAVMESGAGFAAEMQAAEERLSEEGIKFELLTPAQYDIDDDPYLHFEERTKLVLVRG